MSREIGDLMTLSTVWIALGFAIIRYLDQSGLWDQATTLSLLAGWLLGIGPLMLVATVLWKLADSE